MDEMILTMAKRRSTRYYKQEPLSEADSTKIELFLKTLEEASGLRFVLVNDDPAVLDKNRDRFHYPDSPNYIAIFHEKDDPLSEMKAGYFGEILVLTLTQMGLGTCWVGSYNPDKMRIQPKENEGCKCVIAVGYQDKGHLPQYHEPKFYDLPDEPDWYKGGISAAMMAPQAMGRQDFRFGHTGNEVRVEKPLGPYRYIDLGILKLHFELGAGKENFTWARPGWEFGF